MDGQQWTAHLSLWRCQEIPFTNTFGLPPDEGRAGHQPCPVQRSPSLVAAGMTPPPFFQNVFFISTYKKGLTSPPKEYKIYSSGKGVAVIGQDEVVKILKKAGWVEAERGKGSHRFLYNPGTGATTTVPSGKDLKKGTLAAIRRQTGIREIR